MRLRLFEPTALFLCAKTGKMQEKPCYGCCWCVHSVLKVYLRAVRMGMSLN